MHEKRYRHPDYQTSPRRRSFEKTTETTSMAVGAVGLGLEKRDGKSKIYGKNIEKRSNSQNDGSNWKKTYGKLVAIILWFDIFIQKSRGSFSHFSRFSETLSSPRSCHNDDVPNLPSQQDLSSPKKKSCNSSPKCWFLQTKPVSSHGRSVVNKKKSPIFYGWHRSKEKLFSESSKGEDVFAPRSSGFCREKI